MSKDAEERVVDATPTDRELIQLREIVNIPEIRHAWLHTGDDLREEPADFRLVIELEKGMGGLVRTRSALSLRAREAAVSIHTFVTRSKRVDIAPWLIESSIVLK